MESMWCIFLQELRISNQHCTYKLLINWQYSVMEYNLKKPHWQRVDSNLRRRLSVNCLAIH